MKTIPEIDLHPTAIGKVFDDHVYQCRAWIAEADKGWEVTAVRMNRLSARGETPEQALDAFREKCKSLLGVFVRNNEPIPWEPVLESKRKRRPATAVEKCVLIDLSDIHDQQVIDEALADEGERVPYESFRKNLNL